MRGRHCDPNGQEPKHDKGGPIRAIQRRRESNRGEPCAEQERLEDPQSDRKNPVDRRQNLTSQATSKTECQRDLGCEQDMRGAAAQGVLDDERPRIDYPALRIGALKDVLHMCHE